MTQREWTFYACLVLARLPAIFGFAILFTTGCVTFGIAWTAISTGMAPGEIWRFVLSLSASDRFQFALVYVPLCLMGMIAFLMPFADLASIDWTRFKSEIRTMRIVDVFDRRNYSRFFKG